MTPGYDAAPGVMARAGSAVVKAYVRRYPRRRGTYRLRTYAERRFFVARLERGPWMRLTGASECDWWALSGLPANESETMSIVRAVLRPGMSFFDIGANIGVYSLIAAPLVGGTGSVHAFEPTPDIADALRRNVALNGCRNVVVNQLAMSSANGYTSFNLHEDAVFNSLFLQQDGCSSTESVETMTLEAYVESRGIVPDVMKIDCEGAELEVIRGGSKLLGRRDAPTLFVELNPETLAGAGTTVDELLERLRGLDYRCFDVGTFVPGGHRFHNAVACKRAVLERMPALRAWSEQAAPASDWAESRR
jgi:FkbM family methyltransferase